MNGILCIFGNSLEKDTIGNSGGIYRLNSDGSTTRIALLRNMRAPARISPDRALIASASSSDGAPVATIYRLDDTASEVATTSGRVVGWQDRDTLIVDRSQSDGIRPTAELFRFHISTNQSTFITARQARTAEPSPDGKVIAFEDGYQIFTIPANGSDVTVRVDVKDLPPGDRQII